MPKASQLRPCFVEEMPSEILDGILYISKRFKTASHRCCCGCGARVVTPLNPAKWRLIEHQGSVSLRPSIGNWSLPCRSHYWVERNRVKWAGDMSGTQVRRVRAGDARAVQAWASEKPTVGQGAHRLCPSETEPQSLRDSFLHRLLVQLKALLS